MRCIHLRDPEPGEIRLEKLQRLLLVRGAIRANAFDQGLDFLQGRLEGGPNCNKTNVLTKQQGSVADRVPQLARERHPGHAASRGRELLKDAQGQVFDCVGVRVEHFRKVCHPDEAKVSLAVQAEAVPNLAACRSRSKSCGSKTTTKNRFSSLSQEPYRIARNPRLASCMMDIEDASDLSWHMDGSMSKCRPTHALNQTSPTSSRKVKSVILREASPRHASILRCFHRPAPSSTRFKSNCITP